MNLTLDAMAYDLWLTIRNGKITDDDELDLRQIKFWIRNNRATWIKNELNKGKPVSQRFIQDVNGGCVELVRVDKSLCPLVPVGCTILRTADPIPNTIEKHNTPTITRVGPAFIDEASYYIIPYERVPFIGTGRFNSNAIYAFWKDNYIYVISRSSSLDFRGMSKCNIRGVFVDPELVPGYDATKDYPITEHLYVYLKDMIIKTDVRTFLTTVSDDRNDSADTATPTEGQA